MAEGENVEKLSSNHCSIIKLAIQFAILCGRHMALHVTVMFMFVYPFVSSVCYESCLDHTAYI